ncbi:hypothetical protein EDD85DRAFT_961494 [Armillaria nabsnona]|nr:hypothetical protein EDD85DRAFT_961494 [Armillaria nabsnona]
MDIHRRDGRLPSGNGARKEIKRKHRDIKGVSSVDEFRDAIQAHKERAYLKMDFVIGDCILEVMCTHCLLHV